MATTETTKQVDDPDIEAIIETIVQERPWRGPIYALTYFFRRWMVTLFTLTAAIGNG